MVVCGYFELGTYERWIVQGVALVSLWECVGGSLVFEDALWSMSYVYVY